MSKYEKEVSTHDDTTPSWVDFELGEDVRDEDRQRQDAEWAEAVADGRAHVSHREMAMLNAPQICMAIADYKLIETMVSAMHTRSGRLRLLTPELLTFIVEYAMPGQGHLVHAAVERRRVAPLIRGSRGERTKQLNADFPFRICVRRRPMLDWEHAFGAYDVCDTDNGNIVTLHEGRLARNARQLYMTHHQYVVDRVFSEQCDNAEVCADAVEPLLQWAAVGRSSTLLCFGQTGTGKTYTLYGALEYLSRQLVGRSVRVTFYEVHGKKCYDLLASRKVVHLRADSQDRMHIRGARRVELHPLRQAVELLEVLREALRLRSSKVTERNPISSRSHAVCTLEISTTTLPLSSHAAAETGTVDESRRRERAGDEAGIYTGDASTVHGFKAKPLKPQSLASFLGHRGASTDTPGGDLPLPTPPTHPSAACAAAAVNSCSEELGNNLNNSGNYSEDVSGDSCDDIEDEEEEEEEKEKVGELDNEEDIPKLSTSSSTFSCVQASSTLKGASAASSPGRLSSSAFDSADTCAFGTITLVDLAGSERNYETTKMTAAQHLESADINFALMALKDCFRAFQLQLDRDEADATTAATTAAAAASSATNVGQEGVIGGERLTAQPTDGGTAMPAGSSLCFTDSGKLKIKSTVDGSILPATALSTPIAAVASAASSSASVSGSTGATATFSTSTIGYRVGSNANGKAKGSGSQGKTAAEIATGVEQGSKSSKAALRIPFRSSLLTRVLKQCFTSGPLHRTTIIATVSPTPVDLQHSINTLAHVVLMCPQLHSLAHRLCVEAPLAAFGAAHLSKKAVHLWNADEVKAWLATAERGRFAHVVLPTGIDGAGLLQLSAANLSDLFAAQQLNEARNVKEGAAWVESAAEEDSRRARLVGRQLWSALRREMQNILARSSTTGK